MTEKLNNHMPYGPYEKFIKRPLDFVLAMIAITSLSPLFIILIVVGAIAMKGNPFFVQRRPGKIGRDGNEKVFNLIKFRTMSNKRDKDGKLLPDEIRLNKYGKLIRTTSLDELPELINIIKGDMAIVGPRPLLMEYLPYYTNEEHQRHDVRPGLTGWAQVNGRNAIDSWEERFRYDIEYVNHITIGMDIRVLMITIVKVLKRSDIQVGNEIKVGRLDVARRANNNQKV